MVSVSVGSPAGMCTVANPAFYRYVLRLGEAPLSASSADRAQLDVLANVPHAYADEEECAGDGWRIVPAMSYEDWPVLEATPQRLRAAFQTARRLLWKNAGPVGISAGDMIAIDTEIESVLGVLRQAEAGGYSVNVSYVS
ncbi:MAG TPA: hypothetical protein VK665_17360 [Candidatus Elarobacter sp.]|jgi:hypothetical protein|nr:hypothetical protein [Candidatus Elarobacter sp.]HTD35440.1 hypothetical protein [Candidatus Elarobacter sp.]HTD36473.1 hypothetical protein [Candidatus Limnocylindrales bacterium]